MRCGEKGENGLNLIYKGELKRFFTQQHKTLMVKCSDSKCNQLKGTIYDNQQRLTKTAGSYVQF